MKTGPWGSQEMFLDFSHREFDILRIWEDRNGDYCAPGLGRVSPFEAYSRDMFMSGGPTWDQMPMDFEENQGRSAEAIFGLEEANLMAQEFEDSAGAPSNRGLERAIENRETDVEDLEEAREGERGEETVAGDEESEASSLREDSDGPNVWDRAERDAQKRGKGHAWSQLRRLVIVDFALAQKTCL